MKDLKPCRKRFTEDQDKARPPEETVRWAKERFAAHGQDILERTERIDTGRLGIPVYLSVCGPQAREVMPTRKQMGKGASSAQAEASAVMELAERYSLFTFQGRAHAFEELTWSEAEARFGSSLLPLEAMLRSVDESLERDLARSMLDLVRWRFCPALAPGESRTVHIPFDWFYTLNEFNGSSAGNTPEEALLQAGCELLERHVCALVDQERPVLPTIRTDEVGDPVLESLVRAFAGEGIELQLKDMSLGFGLPTVGALAYDPSTFPASSEIVFTAGTAPSPHKAAIRALTEVAQLAGDFETGSCYDPSGLSKPASLEECRWIRSGPEVSLADLPDKSREDFLAEILALAHGLADWGYTWYAVDTTDPDLGIPACYCAVPGFLFRERTKRASLGLFVGRLLAEEAAPEEAELGLAALERLQPGAFYLPFFQGLLKLRTGELKEALPLLDQAEAIQPSPEEQGLAAFYAGYARTQLGQWQQALPFLDRAVERSPEVHAYVNLRGVARFKLEGYREAAEDFERALELDGGSAVDLANLGLCARHLGRREEAAAFLHRSLEIDPGLAFARDALDDLLAGAWHS